MIETDYCDLCQSKDHFLYISSGQDKFYGIDGSFNLNKCQNCGLLFINHMPGREEIKGYYPSEEYYSFAGGKEHMAFMHKLGFSFRHPFQAILAVLKNTVKRSAPLKENGNFLDIGCGLGDFLIEMKRKSAMKFYGVGVGGSVGDRLEKLGINFYNGDLVNAKFTDEFFDAVTMNHVLEHVHSPSETLQEVVRVLKSGGRLVIAVPNINSTAFKIFKDNWVGYPQAFV